MTRQITVMTPENVEVTFELAGLGSRFMAMVLDALLQGLMMLVIIFLFWGVFHLYSILDAFSSWPVAILLLLLFAVWEGYFLYFEATRNGQTPGKKALGIRVIRDTGHPLDFRSAVLRNVMRMVDGLPALYAVGAVSIFLSSQYRRLGDYVGGTLVVKTQQKQAVPTSVLPDASPETSPVGAPDALEPLLPVEALPYLQAVTRDDYRAVRHFLNRRRELDSAVAQSLAAKLAEPLAGKLQLDPSAVGDPILFLENLAGEWERRMIH